MKLIKPSSAAMALALVALLSTSAQAQNTYTPGDVIIGFEQANNASDYVVDLGSFSQFTLGQNLTFNLSGSTSTSDLDIVFGTSWASNSQTNLVQWGVIGNDTNTDDLFYTLGRTNTANKTTSPNELSDNAQEGVETNLQGLQTGSLTGFAGSTPSSGSTSKLQATVQTASDANSWSSGGGTGDPNTYGFGLGKNIEQPKTGSYTGPTDSVLDLYESVPTSLSNQKALYLGDFSLSSNGTLTFDSATVAVPEPSSTALFGIALALFAALHRRRTVSVR